MLYKIFICCLSLFNVSLIGILVNRKNLIVTLICIEFALMSVNLNFI